MTIEEKSEHFARIWHEETNHKYDGKPYIYHLKMVVDTAKENITPIPYEDRQFVIGGCWLHDSIEDTRRSRNDVRDAVCHEVAELAYALTNEKGRTRAERANQKYYKGIRKTEYATFIKLCDRIANVSYSYQKNKDGGMFKKYQKENDKFIWELIKPEWYQFDKHLIRLFLGKKYFKVHRFKTHKYRNLIFKLLMECRQNNNYSFTI